MSRPSCGAPYQRRNRCRRLWPSVKLRISVAPKQPRVRPTPHGGIDLDRSHAFEREITHGCEGIKPGWVRINFNYFISDAVFSYLVEAVRLVATDGWRLLEDYRFDPASGMWRHHLGPVEPPLRLRQISYDENGAMQYPHHETAPAMIAAQPSSQPNPGLRNLHPYATSRTAPQNPATNPLQTPHTSCSKAKAAQATRSGSWIPSVMHERVPNFR